MEELNLNGAQVNIKDKLLSNVIYENVVDQIDKKIKDSKETRLLFKKSKDSKNIIAQTSTSPERSTLYNYPSETPTKLMNMTLRSFKL